jgi:hypothetical protein
MLMMALWPSSTCKGAEVGDGSPLKTGLSEKKDEKNLTDFLVSINYYYDIPKMG